MKSYFSQWSAVATSISVARRLAPAPVMLARAAALSLLAVYLAVVVAGYHSTSQPVTFGSSVRPCGENVCVSAVAPGGWEWSLGVRPGMTLLSLNGWAVGPSDVRIIAATPITHADVQTRGGEVLQLRITEEPVGRSPMRESLWVVGALFALLGAVVVVRRPDLAAARLFWLFAGSAAVGLAAAPSAAGAGAWWARILEVSALVGLGFAFVPLALALIRKTGSAPDLQVVATWGAIGVAFLLATACPCSLGRPSTRGYALPSCCTWPPPSSLAWECWG